MERLKLDCLDFECYKNKKNKTAMIDQGEYLNNSEYSLPTKRFVLI